MAAYRQVYDWRHLQADYQELGSAPEPYVRQSSIGYLYFFTSDYLRYLRKKTICNPLFHPTWICTTLTCEVPNIFYLTEGLHCTCIFRTCFFQYLRFQRPRQRTHSPAAAVRGGRPARSFRPWGRVQQMLGVQQWIADVVAPPSVAVWLTWDTACR